MGNVSESGREKYPRKEREKRERQRNDLLVRVWGSFLKESLFETMKIMYKLKIILKITKHCKS